MCYISNFATKKVRSVTPNHYLRDISLNIIRSALCPCGVYSELSNLKNLITWGTHKQKMLIGAITTMYTDRQTLRALRIKFR